jgi:hypothetical protein
MANKILAHMWYNLAASITNDATIRRSAIEGRDAAAALMTPSQIAEAEAKAQACESSEFSNCD